MPHFRCWIRPGKFLKFPPKLSWLIALLDLVVFEAVNYRDDGIKSCNISRCVKNNYIVADYSYNRDKGEF